MGARAYYNEIDPYCTEWLENLIAAGLVPPGDVDPRPIQEVQPSELQGYGQCHFFAGIGGWAYACRLAGLPDDAPVWTGSCPCQPFSSAARGRGEGFGGANDLWPHWRKIIAERQPPALFGEQVTGKTAWLDRVCDDMEALGYTVQAAVLPACSVGLDHARPRIYFACHAHRESKPVLPLNEEVAGLPGRGSDTGSVVQAHGVPARVAKLRALGNAIVPQVAAEVIKAGLGHE